MAQIYSCHEIHLKLFHTADILQLFDIEEEEEENDATQVG